MRSIRQVLLASVLAVAPAAFSLSAASAPVASPPIATGTISGRVQNVVTGQYLNNARVTLKGTTTTVYTDSFGAYQLVGVPAGTATLEVFYTNLDSAVFAVDVPA